MKKAILILLVGLLWCNVGFADDINFNLKLSCTLIEKKNIEGKKTWPMDKSI